MLFLWWLIHICCWLCFHLRYSFILFVFVWVFSLYCEDNFYTNGHNWFLFFALTRLKLFHSFLPFPHEFFCHCCWNHDQYYFFPFNFQQFSWQSDSIFRLFRLGKGEDTFKVGGDSDRSDSGCCGVGGCFGLLHALLY